MKIEEFTQKIYEEGIDKAKKEEQKLLDAARKEAARIVAEARQAADETVNAAKKEAEEAKETLERELKKAGDLALTQIKRRITDCVVEQVLPATVSGALQDTAFLQKLILEIAGRWNTSQPDVAIEAALPAQDRERLGEHFAAQTKQLLDAGVTVTFSDEVRNGFVIRPKDGTYKISFAEESFASFFREFLRGRTRDLLFPGGTAEDADSSAGPEGKKA